MDTVHEENASDPENMETPSSVHGNHASLSDSVNNDGHARSQTNSRRPSIILAALRRPSQTLGISNHSMMNQRRLLVELAQKFKSSEEHASNEKNKVKNDYNKRLGDDALTTALSALYAKLIVVLGIAFPITEIVSLKVPASFYQGFYLYLYSVSLIFILFMYATFIRENAKQSEQNSLHDNEKNFMHKKEEVKIVRYGSFYLRLGAVAFGIGSMVYSGLEFGQYFELKGDSRCSNVLLALTPAARMILTLVQMQFIFVNSKEMELNRHILVARFGMMHLIATNLCEWLYVLVEETKHEILHLQHGMYEHMGNSTLNSSTVAQHHMTKRSAPDNDIIECRRTNIMGSLVQNASPFLFPCTVEYSLICAVILFEMWKNIKVRKTAQLDRTGKVTPADSRSRSCHNSMSHEKLIHQFSILFGGAKNPRSSHHFSVDCAGAHRGLFSGILIIVVTIISLIMFFVLNKDPLLNKMAIYEVNVCELILYIITLLAVAIAMIQMRNLKFYKKNGNTASLSLDTTLLVMAQTGVFIYCMFSIIGSYFTIDAPQGTGILGLVSELFSLIQAVVQTMFVLGSWWRRCSSRAQIRKRPGRQVITFLLVANMALWTTNTLEKGRAEFRPTHLTFFGVWPWTVITHVSMPLVIFYRFHSTICLFEIWKNAYKIKSEHH
ncbi:proton channel OtopLc-like isoform X2 [Arctopsyche grandis]|uniref:proton channel OtopLc-like isoform X2 n=1 Tax=Arctopsyche grandis TaxID=121162 RepID=UPI00406D9715